MGRSKHSKGPWETFIAPCGTIAVGFPPNPGERPCVVDWPGFEDCGLPLGTQKANARLIAAAPELLEALGCLVAVLELAWSDEQKLAVPEFQEAKEVIAKARGNEGGE